MSSMVRHIQLTIPFESVVDWMHNSRREYSDQMVEFEPISADE